MICFGNGFETLPDRVHGFDYSTPSGTRCGVAADADRLRAAPLPGQARGGRTLREGERMDDLALSDLLSSRGFEDEGAERALDLLCRNGLTRPGKSRIATAKIEAVDRTLKAALVRHCRKPACLPPPGDGREPVPVAAAHCETCGGSDNRRAVERMLEAMDRAGWTRLLVAGGSPGTRGELERLCAGRLDLRFVTEDTTPNRKTVAPLLAWSDVAAIWTSTEISHKTTAVLRGRKVLKVPRRSVAALAEAVQKRCSLAA